MEAKPTSAEVHCMVEGYSKYGIWTSDRWATCRRGSMRVLTVGVWLPSHRAFITETKGDKL